MPPSIRRKMLRAVELVRLMRLRASEGHLPPVRQAFEAWYLWRFRKLRPSTYFATGLYQRDIPWRDKLEFVGSKRYEEALMSINRERYRFITLNKLVTYGMFRTFNIPTPAVYGFINASDGRTFDGAPLCNASDLADLIRRLRLKRVCFKPVGGWEGRGFAKVDCDPARDPVTVRVVPEGPVMTLDEFWRTHFEGDGGGARAHLSLGFLCQAEVTQHAEVAALHPQSLNTTRLWMYQLRPGRWEPFSAHMRMGVGSSAVDNTAAGNIGAGVDIETGRLKAAVRNVLERPTFDVHPDTGEPIAGRILPMWHDAISLARRTCELFPYLGLLGLDIAYTVDGPMIMELEAEPHTAHQVFTQRGIAPLLRTLSARDRELVDVA